MPIGKHCAEGISFRLLSARPLHIDAAEGSISGVPRSAVLGCNQRPEKSGFPSVMRGVGPEGGCGVEKRSACCEPRVHASISGPITRLRCRILLALIVCLG